MGAELSAPILTYQEECMAVELFGFSIGRVDKDEKNKKSFALPEPEDGALEVGPTGGAYGTYVDLEGVTKNEQELIIKECGEDSNKLFFLMSDLSKSQVKTMLTSKLRASFKKMRLYSASDSHTLVQEYADKIGIPDEYINLLA